MKITKMSLVTALLIGSSAFAIENTKVSGDANVYYNTNDKGSNSVFDKESSAADIGLNLNLTSDLMKTDSVSVSTGVGISVLSTLGLENNLVGNVWGGAHTASASTGSTFAGGYKVDTAWWINEAWMAATTGKTTAKLGRMELDTPLAFTEKWSIEKNTFEAVVLLNQDIPDTTLVGAYIGKGNGNETFGENAQSNVQTLGLANGPVLNGNGAFITYGTDGAYAIAAINNSWEPLTVQGWYYDVTSLVQAYWLQADFKMEGIMAGAQYSGHELDNKSVADGTKSNVYALMLGYEMKDTFTAKVAYSQVDKDFAAGFNTATDSGDSKLYTQPWWSRGYVTQADTQSYRVCVSSPVNGIVDLGVHYSNVDQGNDITNPNVNDNDLQEITLTAGKSFGPLDATLVYSNIDADDQNNGSDYNQVQVYLTANF